jgi:hypothetical protein
MFLRNVGSYKSHTAEHPRRRHSSKPLVISEFFRQGYSPIIKRLRILGKKCRPPALQLDILDAENITLHSNLRVAFRDICLR